MSDSTIVPDTKDWTWVLREPCPECGYDAREVTRESLGDRIRENAAQWARALAEPRATQRPDPATWSPLEYACHVRDVNLVFSTRLGSMLVQENPLFANWDQDVTAVEEGYAAQQPAAVAAELAVAAETVAARYDAVTDDQWGRAGTRSDGSVFTVESLGRYHLHDLDHHVWDVRPRDTLVP